MQEYRNKPEIIEARRAYNLDYINRPDVKEHRKTYNALLEKTEKVKTRRKKYRNTIRGRASAMIREIKYRSKRKGIEFNLSQDWLVPKLDAAKCEFSDINLQEHVYILRPSIDRIDNDLPYIVDNCRLICFGINAMKGTNQDKQVILAAKAIEGDNDALMAINKLKSPIIQTIPPEIKGYHRYKLTINGQASRITARTKIRAKKKNLTFNLSTEWILDKLSVGICELSGIQFNKNIRMFSPSIDRIIPDRGYTKSNCRMICLCYNDLKGQYGDSHVKSICEAILRAN